jgi:hypothetical protein
LVLDSNRLTACDRDHFHAPSELRGGRRRCFDAGPGILPPVLLSRTVIIACLVLVPIAALAAERSRAVKQEFQQRHPCPSTGRTTGPCPGYIKDHIIPLACGGPDNPANLQWQTTAAAKAKDKWERTGCIRGQRKGQPGGDANGIVLRGR